jgi:hypothetical protein
VIAHVGGLPIEETIVQLAPAGVGVLVALRLASGRIRRTIGLGFRARLSAARRARA